MSKNKKKKEKYVDDGHTIYNMDIDGFKWHDRNVKKNLNQHIDKKEKWHLIKAAYKAYLPAMICTILAFCLTIILIYFWLKH